jgi:hypothetical protein
LTLKKIKMDIDFVVPWVDGSNSTWQSKKDDIMHYSYGTYY